MFHATDSQMFKTLVYMMFKSINRFCPIIKPGDDQVIRAIVTMNNETRRINFKIHLMHSKKKKRNYRIRIFRFYSFGYMEA